MTRLVLENATIVDAPKGRRAGAVVVIEGGRIAAVAAAGQGVELRPDDRRVDLRGRTLMPGMASCHFHTTFEGVTPVSAPSLGLHAPPAYLALVAAKNARVALEHGLTTILCSSTCYAIDAALKRAIEEGWTPGPRMWAGSRELMTTGDLASGVSRNWYMDLGNPGIPRFADGAEGFRAAVRDEIKKGAEIVKLSASQGHNAGTTVDTPNLSDAEMQAAVDAAHHRHALVRAHAASRSAILQCVRAGVDLVDHADQSDAECLDAMAAADTTIVPSPYYVYRTLQGYEAGAFDAMFPDGDPPQMLHDVMADMRRGMENVARFLPEAIDRGVRIVAGDDYGTGFLPHGEYGRELSFYVKEIGIAPLEVIRWATLAPAEVVGMAEELGSVEPGKLADLVIVDGDPLSDIGCLETNEAIDAVLKGGSVVVGSLESAAER